MPVDERTFVAEVANWVTEVLARHPELPYGPARVEVHVSGSLERHDFVLYRRGTARAVLTGEVKMPDSPMGRSPYHQGLMDDAFSKASREGIPYYFTWNVKQLALFRTHGDNVPFNERQIEEWPVADVAISDDVTRPHVIEAIKGFWERFLASLAALEAGQRELRNLPLDQRFARRLDTALQDPIMDTEDELVRRCRHDQDFRARLILWMVSEQGWENADTNNVSRQNLERAARLSCYVLVTRLVFYEVLRRRFRLLSPLAWLAPRSPEELAQFLDARFGEAVRYSRDYETIFQPQDFGSSLPFLAPQAHQVWPRVIRRIEEFDFTRLDFDIIGQLYERLIGDRERRQYGQFYTSPDVVDLINAFCIRSHDARVLDPACGGTFLVWAYARKRALARRIGLAPSHQQLIGQLFGVDIASFPAQLATINLAVRHLSDEPHYPLVARSDFFDAQRGMPLYRVPLSGDDMQRIALADLDAVVGNPPYIRQEELSREYKDRLLNLFASEWPGLTPPSGRSDIYVYFFTHAAALLKPDGRLGFVTSIGWLDTDYGFRLQEFFLKHFRIIAVIESQVEKWFEDARVTTCVTILQREPDAARRDANPVRFIQLRRPLSEIYTFALNGPISDASEEARQADMDAVRDLIEQMAANENNDYWRVRVLTQRELWEAGCRLRVEPEETSPPEFPSPRVERGNSGGEVYRGGKWGQYLRAPDVWFDILDRARSRMVPLQELAEIRRGFTSGVDRFFCVRDVTVQELQRFPDPREFRERWGLSPEETSRVRIVRDGEGGLHLVEARFLEPEFHTLMEAKSIVIRASDVKRLVINAPVPRASLRRTHLGSYIAHAERQGWHTGVTVASRAQSRPWYDLGLRPREERAQMFWPMAQQYRHIVPWNQDSLPCNHNLFDIWSGQGVSHRLLWAVLNSTIVALSKHQFGRAAGIEGNLKTEVLDVNMMLVPDVRQASADAAGRAMAAAQRMAQREARRTLPDEFGLADRQDLDDAVLEMLGFQDAAERRAIRQRLYAALQDMYGAIRDRELIAQRDRRRSARSGVASAADMADEVWDEHHASWGLQEFPADFLMHPNQGQPFDLPPGPVEVGTAMLETGRQLRAGTVRIGGPRDGTVLDVGSIARARFLAALAQCGHSGAVRIPDDAECERAVREFERYRSELVSRFAALAAQRTRDQRRQRAIADALLRKALSWRHQQESE